MPDSETVESEAASSGAINSQVGDAVRQIDAKALGGSPAQALAAATQAMAHAMGLAMENATMAQAAVQQINNAAMSMVITQILKGPGEAHALASIPPTEQGPSQ